MTDDDPTAADTFIAAVLKVAGRDGLAKVRAIAGGTHLHVAKYAAEGSVIVRALGMDDARKVLNELRVCDADGRPMAFPPFYLSNGVWKPQTDRRNQVAILVKRGLNKTKIAIELGVSDATVSRDIRILRAAGKLSLAPPKNSDTRTAIPPSDEVP